MVIRNNTASDIHIISLKGITIPASSDYLINHRISNVWRHNNELKNLISLGDLSIIGDFGETIDTLNALQNVGIHQISRNIDGQTIYFFRDIDRNKFLSVETQNVLWSENKLSSKEWIGLSRAVDRLSGWVASMNCTIVGVMAQSSKVDSSAKPIDLYIDDNNNGTLFSFAGTSTEDRQIDNTINIDVDAGQKLRLKCNSGHTIQDTIIELRIRWRL